MLLRIAVVHSFLLLYNILLCDYIIVFLYVYFYWTFDFFFFFTRLHIASVSFGVYYIAALKVTKMKKVNA